MPEVGGNEGAIVNDPVRGMNVKREAEEHETYVLFAREVDAVF